MKFVCMITQLITKHIIHKERERERLYKEQIRTKEKWQGKRKSQGKYAVNSEDKRICDI